MTTSTQQDNIDLLCFKAISEFVNDLGEIFSNRQHSLKLYSRLIKKTTLSHHESIKRHIQAFRLFCISNRISILEKNSSKIKSETILYSEKVCINMKDIFNVAGRDDVDTIWTHLLFISSYVDPTSRARELLKKEKTTENDFLSEIIQKVEKEVDPDSNPMDALSSMIQSGVITDLVKNMNSGLNNGSLDIGKLVGTVQNMMGALNENNGGGNEDPLNMISGLMNNLTSMTSNDSGGSGSSDNNSSLDLANMMNIIGKLQQKN